MDTSGEEMHPNWCALATIHFPLKRFIREGAQAADKGIATKQGTKYKITGVSGVEVKEFYEEITKDEQYKKKSKANKGKIANADTVNKHYECTKEPFNKERYFRFAISNNIEELKKFDYHESDVNSRDVFSWTALMMAACEGAEAAVKFLLELGVDREAIDKSGNTALNLAKKKGHLNIIKLLEGKTMFLENEAEMKDSSTQASIHPFFCATCKHSFTETTLRDHHTSTVHQFNEKSILPANKLQKFNIPPKNRGLQLMVKQGWDRESGLGPTQAGRLYPVKTVIRKQRSGLGIEQPLARVTHFEAFDLRATQRRNSNYYKAKPRTRNDMRREKKREWKRDRRLRNELS